MERLKTIIHTIINKTTYFPVNEILTFRKSKQNYKRYKKLNQIKVRLEKCTQSKKRARTK